MHKNLDCYTRYFQVLSKNKRFQSDIFFFKAQENSYLEKRELEVASLNKRNNESYFFQDQNFFSYGQIPVLAH